MSKSFLGFLICLVWTSLYSCNCSCDCEKDLGCVILAATHNSINDTIEIKTFCSQVNINSDQILIDSVQAFYDRYQTDSTSVNRIDSITKSYRLTDLTCH